MIAFYASQLSDHMAKTPEGYLVCYAVPINRTGEQVYAAKDLKLDGDPDRAVTVYRLGEDVFAPAALASFEGKDVTNTHPPENLTPETQAAYSKGHLENVRRVGENTVADLMIKDPVLISDVENGVMREVSCGYVCTYVPYKDGYKQTNIVGNHVAVVPRGRAGATVAIKDAALGAEKGRKTCMSKFAEAILTAFGMAAKDAQSEEELSSLVSTTTKALDAAPAEPDEGKAPEAEPAEDATPTEDVMVERAPKGDDLGSKLDRIISMLQELDKKNDREEKKLSSEDDLDELLEKMAGKHHDPEAAVTVPAEEMEDGCTMDSATVALLKRVRPAVAGIKDPKEKARVVDALLGTVKDSSTMSAIFAATQDSARRSAAVTQKTTFEAACAESENAYAALNPHIKKEG